MPWTVSHAAAVLPLRRSTPWPLDFPALVIGSMTPDIGYYIGRFDLATFDHTFVGSFVAGLPTGIVLLLLFYVFCKPIAFSLPQPHRAALEPLCPSFGGLRPARWFILLCSLLLGIWTHIFWDAFTHDTGWFVERIAWLRTPSVQLGAAKWGLPFVLQVASTFIGLAILIYAYFRWLRRQPSGVVAATETDRWRYLLALLICGGALAIALPAAWHFAAGRQGAMFVRAVMFRTALYGPEIAVPVGLLVASIIYLRARRG